MKYLTLVNKDNKIKESYYKKINLTKTTSIYNKEILIEENTYEAYLKLKEFLETKNIIIGIDTAYRTVEEQEEILKYYTKEEGKEYCEKYVAIPYYSEHHTGLAVDITIKINNEFIVGDPNLLKYDEIFKKIHPYLADYGFILRYPEEKRNITGYNYEPWHLRYVGKVPAKIIFENKMCLEEYLTDFGGVLVVNKEKNMTSFDIVNEASHILGIKKIGHTGTLDPLATGVLVLTIGKYTKLGEELTALDKEYIAEVKEGILTDTLDITGNIEKENNNRLENIEESLNKFKKTYMQEVPKYSAVKVNGKKLYEYARKNEEVKLPKKEVTIKNIELINKTSTGFTFKTTVSKGTYIRSLIRDIGIENNTLLTMTELTRTRQGKFKIEDSYTLKEVKEGNFKILKIKDILDYKIIEVDKSLAKKINNGVIIDNTYNIENKVMFSYQNKILAIYKKEKDKLRMHKKIN